MNQWHGMCCVIIISRINHDFNRLHYGLLNVNLVVRLLFMYVSNIVCVVRHHSACCHIQKWLNGREPEFILPSVISKDWIFAHFNFVSRTSLMFVCVCKHFMCVCVFDQHDTSIWTEYVQCAYVCLCANRIRRHIMRLCGNQIKRMSVVFGFSHFWYINHSGVFSNKSFVWEWSGFGLRFQLIKSNVNICHRNWILANSFSINSQLVEIYLYANS